jgi:hypothetical protein
MRVLPACIMNDGHQYLLIYLNPFGAKLLFIWVPGIKPLYPSPRLREERLNPGMTKM